MNPRTILAPGWTVSPYRATSTGYARTRPCWGMGTAEISCRDGRIVVGVVNRFGPTRGSAEASFWITQANVMATQHSRAGRNFKVLSSTALSAKMMRCLYCCRFDVTKAQLCFSVGPANQSRKFIPIVPIVRCSLWICRLPQNSASPIGRVLAIVMTWPLWNSRPSRPSSEPVTIPPRVKRSVQSRPRL